MRNFQNDHETHYKLKDTDNLKHGMNTENGPTNTDGGSSTQKLLVT